MRTCRAATAIESLEIRRLLSTTWYVDAAASGATHNGTSWATAYTDLQQGLSSAAAGDAIHVAQGTYKPTATTNRAISFQLKNGVEIDGGYAGSTSATPDARDVTEYPTILSGDIGTVGDKLDNSYHVVVGSGTNSTTVLDGVTISGGLAEQSLDTSYNLYGAGMFSQYGSPTLNNCTFTGNAAVLEGGAMYNENSSPTLTNCRFMGNSAGDGGAIANYSSSSPVLTNSIFSGNSAFDGGAIYDKSSSPKLTNCTLSGNSAYLSGGVIYDDSSTPTLTNCILWDNYQQTGATVFGGGEKITYSDIQGGFSGTGNVNFDPLLLRYPSRGADGIWQTADDDYGDLRLPTYSPVADRGSNAAVPAGTTTDLAGNARIQDIPTAGTTTPIVDMGAYEAAPSFSATIGGPYRVIQNQSITLVAHGASDVAGALQYSWDLNNDGVFGDATTQTRVFSATSTLGVIPISMQLTDAAAHTLIISTTITVVPATVYVDGSAPGPVHDGSSWSAAFTTLGDALTAAVPGQRIDVAQGTYKPTTTSDRTATFVLQDGVAIYGGYTGHSALNPDARDVITYPTVLSGDIGLIGNDSDNSMHIVNGSYTDSSAVIDGMTITQGNAFISGKPGYGGGGGMYDVSGSPALNDCIFSGNDGSVGGAMYNDSSSPTLTNCTFIGNSANEGGAIRDFSGCSPILTNCTFIGNQAGYGGGAFFTYYTTSVPVLTNCIFNGNSSSYAGGAVYAFDCSPVVTGCVFTGNTAADYGGAVYNEDQADPKLVNCTLVANSARDGGGIYDYQNSSPVLTNGVLWGNVASDSGAQVYDYPTPDYSHLSASHSDIEGGYAGNIDADPLFYRNPSPGVDGTWGTADDDYGDLRLLPGSPCIDTGLNSAVPAGVTTDLAGNPRIVDFPGVKAPGAIVDMGAYEANTNLGAMHLSGGQNVVLPAGGHVFTLSQLTIDPGATLDVKDNDLFLPAATLGTWNNPAYDGITGMVETGAIFSSSLQDKFTTLGVASASQILGIAGSQTALFDGQTVSPGDVLVKFTYVGDANLDGKVNIDDYGRIDGKVGQSGQVFGWFNGDFNYDGKINIDDYGLIDGVIGVQGPVL